MDKEKRFGKIKTNMKANMKTIYKMDKVNIHGIMAMFIKDRG